MKILKIQSEDGQALEINLNEGTKDEAPSILIEIQDNEEMIVGINIHNPDDIKVLEDWLYDFRLKIDQWKNGLKTVVKS